MAFKIPDTPEELFRQGMEQFSFFNRLVPFLGLILFVLVVVLSSFYVVETDEVGVIRQFGKYARVTEPGLHWKLPLGIETLNLVKVRRVLKEEFGFRTLKSGGNGYGSDYSSDSPDEEAMMLTGDLNVLDVSWIVQFKIKDPIKLLFNVRNPLATVRDVAESTMQLVIGDSSVSEALTTRRNAIDLEVAERMQKLLDEYETGIDVTTVKLQDVAPPRPVQQSFNEVNNAKQEKERAINQAQEQRNKIIPQARGEAEKTIQESQAYSVARIKRAEGEATKFLETWNAYKTAKDPTRRRLYLETLTDTIPSAGKVYIFDPKAKNILPLLNLSEAK